MSEPNFSNYANQVYLTPEANHPIDDLAVDVLGLPVHSGMLKHHKSQSPGGEYARISRSLTVDGADILGYAIRWGYYAGEADTAVIGLGSHNQVEEESDKLGVQLIQESSGSDFPRYMHESIEIDESGRLFSGMLVVNNLVEIDHNSLLSVDGANTGENAASSYLPELSINGRTVVDAMRNLFIRSNRSSR